MTRGAFQSLLLAAGITTALIGLYIASRTSPEFRWDSAVSILIIAAGAYMAVVGLVMVLGFGERAEDAHRPILPEASITLVYGAFVGLISLVAGLVAGHYLGRNAGFLTFIFAFIVANLLFGLPLALARAGSNR